MKKKVVPIIIGLALSTSIVCACGNNSVDLEKAELPQKQIVTSFEQDVTAGKEFSVETIETDTTKEAETKKAPDKTEQEEVYDDIESEIKAVYAKRHSVNDVNILGNYGDFGGAHVVFIEKNSMPYMVDKTIGGVDFHYASYNEIKVYKKGYFYALADAYEKGWVSEENLADIRDKHRADFPAAYDFYESDHIVLAGGERKVYCFPTTDGEFTVGKILVGLSHKASMELNTYTPEDFPEIECDAIEDMMSSCTESLREWKKDPTKDVKGLEERYHQILCITLKSKTKQGVIDAVRALDNREDVLSAEPNWIYHFD